MKGKWYHQWWVYALIAVIFFLIGYIIYRERDVVTQEEVLKEKIRIEIEKNIVADSLYKVLEAEKEKIKIIREKIDITQDIKKLQQLISELEQVKVTPPRQNSTLELKQYLETEF
jgi:hypothetical protein